MHSLQFSRSTFKNESIPMDMICNACRANEERGYVDLPHGYKVEFVQTGAEEYLASVTDCLGRKVASAIVDKYDC